MSQNTWIRREDAMLRASDPWPAPYLQAGQNRDGHLAMEIYFMHFQSRPGALLVLSGDHSSRNASGRRLGASVAFPKHPDRLRASQETVTRAVGGCAGRVPCFESELLIFVSQ